MKIQVYPVDRRQFVGCFNIGVYPYQYQPRPEPEHIPEPKLCSTNIHGLEDIINTGTTDILFTRKDCQSLTS